MRFTPKLPKAGAYEGRRFYPAYANRATNVPVVVRSADGEKTVTVNMRKAAEGGAIRLGSFEFAAGEAGWGEVRTNGTDGCVIADAVQFLPAAGR